jgi:hypothetical protein
MSVGATRGRMCRNPAGRRALPRMLHCFDLPTSLAGKPRARRRGGIGGYLSGLSGDRCERVTGATRNRTNRDPNRAASPFASAGAGEPFALFVRFIGGRSPVGSGPSAPAATATPLSGSRPHTGGDPHSARWPNVSLGILSLYTRQRRAVKKFNGLFGTETAKARLSRGRSRGPAIRAAVSCKGAKARAIRPR